MFGRPMQLVQTDAIPSRQMGQVFIAGHIEQYATADHTAFRYGQNAVFTESATHGRSGIIAVIEFVVEPDVA